MRKLSDWAQENKIPYKKAWQMAKQGTLPIKSEKSSTGRYFVIEPEPEPEKKLIGKVYNLGVPIMTEPKESLASRRNAASTIERTDPFYHIETGVEPFEHSGGTISVQEAIRLCQKTYWNFSIFKNVIDVMTEFSSNRIFFKGKNKKAKVFFEELLKKINISDLQDKFFREYYRSGNVFVYRFDSVIDRENVKKLNEAFDTSFAALKLPVKYVILNPCDIIVGGNISFASAVFYKRLNPYEIERLKNPQSEQELNFFNSLDEQTKKLIKDGKAAAQIDIPLKESNTYPIFYKKQDYEPLSVPMGYPVLRDLNWKAEMKSIDMAISRTVQQAVLLINLGYESKEGEYVFDQKIALATQELFQNESVGKVLVADFNTKVSFIIPQIGDLLDPKKYEVVNEDIKIGLNHILTGRNEKYANQFIQVKLFIQRLEQAREVFLNNFIIPEIERISKAMNFKNYPEPYFEELDLKDETEWSRIVTRLTEIGILTPWEAFESIDSGQIPTKDDSLESQLQYKELKDKGLYQPIVGGPYMQQQLAETRAQQQAEKAKLPGQNGRPPGSTKKQTKKRSTKPVGASNYSLSKVKEKLHLANDIIEETKSALKKKYKLKKLNEQQESLAREIGEAIIINENSKNWKESIAKYVENPDTRNDERFAKIDELAAEHQLSYILASILLESQDA